MSFAHPLLLWGLLAAGVPVLIHLINMLRHRRVRWAAMEFLLLSQKKNRTWVMLKQLLLLLLRIAVIAVLVLAVARPRLTGAWAGRLGASTTHHVLLVDDSFSMSDRWDDTSAWDEALAVVGRIGDESAREVQAQTFTLLRFSRVGPTAASARPDLLQEPVGPDFKDKLDGVLRELTVSQTSAGPGGALEAVEPLLADTAGDHRILYLISDFRERQWADARELKARLGQLQQSGAALHLVRCVDQSRPNLAVADLAPGDDTRAVGVQSSMEVTVQNFGSEPVRNVALAILQDGQPRPAINIGEIPAGRAVKERFPVQFTSAGEHRLTVRLESDAVGADNARHAVVDVPVAVPVLLVDGDPESRGAWYLGAALAPGGAAPSGISPRIEPPRFLSLNPLTDFRAIYLLNVDRLDRTAIEALEKYVAGGGGLALFLGDRTQPRFVNEEFYRGGEGFFPAPLGNQTELPADRLQQAPDLEVGSHPVFRIFAGSRNPFLSTVNVSRYLAVARDWQPGAAAKTEIIARLRNGAPLAIDRHFGDGRVVAFLTSVAPQWNNWARNNPSFVVTMQRLQAYLSWQPKADASLRVGSPLEVRLDPARYGAQVRFAAPVERAEASPSIEAALAPGGSLIASLPTGAAGFYEARLHRKDGAEETRYFAANVDADEGDLKTPELAQLAARLEGVRVNLASARQFHYTPEEQSGGQLAEILLYLLAFLLVCEQILAYSASYHPRVRPQAATAGGAA